MEDYYKAYDDRYRQVHSLGLQWASSRCTPVVSGILEAYGIHKTDAILEIGCGEGRDAAALLEKGYSLTATDVSAEAVRWCRECYPDYAGCFGQLDCLKEAPERPFDFIFAVAVLHMLVLEEHRASFYRFFRDNLSSKGIGLICTMGDGEAEFASDIRAAFALRERTHQETGRRVAIAGTSCRMVSRETFQKELTENGLEILELGMTQAPPDFSQLLYAVVKPDRRNGQKEGVGL